MGGVKKARPLFFQRRLSIEGDTELGLEVKNLMDGGNLDLLPNSMKTLLNQFNWFLCIEGVQSQIHKSEVMKIAFERLKHRLEDILVGDRLLKSVLKRMQKLIWLWAYVRIVI